MRVYLGTNRLGAVTAAFAFFGLACAGAQTATHLYRYKVLTHTGDYEYRDEITGESHNSPYYAVVGPYYSVVKDSEGRIVEESDMRGGKALTTQKYHYNGDETVFNDEEDFTNGEETGTVHYQRNSWGLEVREDDKTTQGALTAYSLSEGTADHVDAWGYDPQSRKTAHDVYWFSPGGEEIRHVTYLSPTSDDSYLDSDIDPDTGHTRSMKQFTAGQLVASHQYIYSSSGDLVRNDAYDAQGRWFLTDNYIDGLWASRLAKFADGNTQENHYTYDDKRWLIRTEIFRNDNLVCTLTYDTQSDGTVKRTLASGPDGSLWAEYPGQIVHDIERSGQAIGRTDAIMHKTGNWG
jgi:hypothetical protein